MEIEKIKWSNVEFYCGKDCRGCGGRAITLPPLIPRLSPPVLLPRNARLYAKLASGLSSALYASLQCKLGSNSEGIAYDSGTPKSLVVAQCNGATSRPNNEN